MPQAPGGDCNVAGGAGSETFLTLSVTKMSPNGTVKFLYITTKEKRENS